MTSFPVLDTQVVERLHLLAEVATGEAARSTDGPFSATRRPGVLAVLVEGDPLHHSLPAALNVMRAGAPTTSKEVMDVGRSGSAGWPAPGAQLAALQFHRDEQPPSVVISYLPA
jgi:hypothetical protein